MKNTSKKTYKIISILFIVMILLGGVDTLFNIFLNNDIKLNSILITITVLINTNKT